MLTLKQLRYFDALVKFGHFGRAAEYCSVTQPALSVQLQELEKDLGIRLVERRNKEVKVTQAGLEIVNRSRQILTAVRDLEDFALHSGKPLSGPLRLGVIPSIAPYLLPPLLPKIRSTFTELDLQIRETQTEILLDELADGTLDLLLVALPLENSNFSTLALFEDEFLLAYSKEKSANAKCRSTDDLLRQNRLLLLEEGHCLRDQALSYCQFRQIGNIDTFGASSISTLVQLVINGMGATLLPEICVDVEAGTSKLELMRFNHPRPSRTVGLAWRKTNPRETDFKSFAELITQTFGNGKKNGHSSKNKIK